MLAPWVELDLPKLLPETQLGRQGDIARLPKTQLGNKETFSVLLHQSRRKAGNSSLLRVGTLNICVVSYVDQKIQ